MKVSFFFRWYDLWIGAFYDQNRRALYICPLPTIGVKIAWGNEADDFHAAVVACEGLEPIAKHQLADYLRRVASDEVYWRSSNTSIATVKEEQKQSTEWQ